MATFFVKGDPVPKGSAKAFYNPRAGKIVVMQTNREKQKPWASLISVSAIAAGVTMCKPTDAIALRLVFWMRRPKDHYNAKGEIKDWAFNLQHIKKPDLDKLIRCVKDALKGIAFHDDSQVTDVDAKKVYVLNVGHTEPGCQIQVWNHA